jgi:hypothetical protein
MFQGFVRVHGGEGTIVWGYHTAAVFRSWTASRTPQGAWTLQATVQRADAYQLRQRPLLFTAPRKGGYYCFPILGLTLGDKTLAATLGPPES